MERTEVICKGVRGGKGMVARFRLLSGQKITRGKDYTPVMPSDDATIVGDVIPPDIRLQIDAN